MSRKRKRIDGEIYYLARMLKSVPCSVDLPGGLRISAQFNPGEVVLVLAEDVEDGGPFFYAIQDGQPYSAILREKDFRLLGEVE